MTSIKACTIIISYANLREENPSVQQMNLLLCDYEKQKFSLVQKGLPRNGKAYNFIRLAAFLNSPPKRYLSNSTMAGI